MRYWLVNYNVKRNDSIDNIEHIHGHDGATQVEFTDPE